MWLVGREEETETKKAVVGRCWESKASAVSENCRGDKRGKLNVKYLGDGRLERTLGAVPTRGNRDSRGVWGRGLTLRVGASRGRMRRGQQEERRKRGEDTAGQGRRGGGSARV